MEETDLIAVFKELTFKIVPDDNTIEQELGKAVDLGN
jgi:hypothetical protein